MHYRTNYQRSQHTRYKEKILISSSNRLKTFPNISCDASLYIYIHIYIYVCIYIYICLYIYIYIHIYIYIYIYIYYIYIIYICKYIYSNNYIQNYSFYSLYSTIVLLYVCTLLWNVYYILLHNIIISLMEKRENFSSQRSVMVIIHISKIYKAWYLTAID